MYLVFKAGLYPGRKYFIVFNPGREKIMNSDKKNSEISNMVEWEVHNGT